MDIVIRIKQTKELIRVPVCVICCQYHIPNYKKKDIVELIKISSKNNQYICKGCLQAVEGKNGEDK
jgi:hypothetical protein